MTDQDLTAIQKMLSEETAENLLHDLKNQSELIPEESELQDVQGFEVAFSITKEDVPYLVEELEEMVDDGG